MSEVASPGQTKLGAIANYLEKHGFSGQIPLNDGPKNQHAIKRLLSQDKFYTFGISGLSQRLKAKGMGIAEIQQVLVESAVSDPSHLKNKIGYFDPERSAQAFWSALEQIRAEATKGRRILFATGHPGSMIGLLTAWADWAENLGAKLTVLAEPIRIKSNYHLDQIGPVLVPSDGCSAWHSHDSYYLDAFLDRESADLVVADHGFIGSALNHGINSIGFYDTNDPAMPLAEFFGWPVLAVPVNDNRYNIAGSDLGRFLIEQLN